MEMTLTKENMESFQKGDDMLRAIDAGIDDMEAGRELPLDEAFKKITELRNIRRNAGI